MISAINSITAKTMTMIRSRSMKMAALSPSVLNSVLYRTDGRVVTAMPALCDLPECQSVTGKSVPNTSSRSKLLLGGGTVPAEIFWRTSLALLPVRLTSCFCVSTL